MNAEGSPRARNQEDVIGLAAGDRRSRIMLMATLLVVLVAGGLHSQVLIWRMTLSSVSVPLTQIAADAVEADSEPLV